MKTYPGKERIFKSPTSSWDPAIHLYDKVYELLAIHFGVGPSKKAYEKCMLEIRKAEKGLEISFLGLVRDNTEVIADMHSLALFVARRLLKTPDGEIEYAVKGEGTPVLLLHGAGGGFDQGLWMSKVFLEDKYKFISVSRYGYLRSPIPDNASIKNQAALYSALLNDLNVTKVIVVAGSAGGASAIQFANDYPEKTSALILLFAVSMPEPGGDVEPISSKIIHLIQQSDYSYWIFSEFMQSSILNLMGVPEEVFKSFDPEQKQFAQEMLDVMHPMTKRYKGTMNDAKMLYLEEISTENITSPTLIMHSKDDALVNYAHAINSHDKIKQSKLILLET